jgi:hypothetical protein
MSPLSGRHILFIGIGFYDYEDSIVARLRQYGAVVTSFSDRPKFLRHGLIAAFLRRTGINLHSIMEQHEKSMLAACANVMFDHVLVIKGTELSISFLKALREQQSASEFILYQWDSLERLSGIQERLPHFDRILTFDRKDAINFPQMVFRPLFFRESLSSNPSNPSIDICFVGWLHSNRLAAVRKMQKDAEALGLTTFVYLYTGLFSWLMLALIGQARDVHFRPLSYKKLMLINMCTGTVLDLPHAAQSGLTMRTIEAIGLGKKLITTARDIINYDFFSNENIHLIESDSINIDPSFISRPAIPIPENVRAKYSLDAWLADIFQIIQSAS